MAKLADDSIGWVFDEMKAIWIDREITYDGTQLRSDWIREQTDAAGDAIASFVGPADVPIENMVDLEDVARNSPIWSESMLHFIVEHPGCELALAIARQRLLAAIAADELRMRGVRLAERRGDDIYDCAKKLSVSIATNSPASSLIHFAINISSRGTPVPTRGLEDYGIDPRALAREVAKRYCDEIESMGAARTKVRPAP